jgi:hypothetical protein
VDDAVTDRRPPPDDQRPTLGRLLDAQARRRTLALQPRLAWARPLAAVLHKAEQLGDVLGERFDRFEGRPGGDPAAGDPAGRPRPGPARPVRPGQPARPSPAAPEPADPGGADRGALTRPGELRDLLPSVRYRLRRDVGAAADAMRVHDGPQADARARAAGADAVTIGRDVHLRQGRYAPHRQETLALLAHEATHVAAVLEPGRAWRAVVGADAEERLARERETRILGAAGGSRTAVPARTSSGRADAGRAHAGRADVARAGAAGVPLPGARPAVAPAAPPAPAGTPRAADADRDLAPAPAGPDLAALRRAVVADVMRQIKTDFERGG